MNSHEDTAPASLREALRAGRSHEERRKKWRRSRWIVPSGCAEIAMRDCSPQSFVASCETIGKTPTARPPNNLHY